MAVLARRIQERIARWLVPGQTEWANRALGKVDHDLYPGEWVFLCSTCRGRLSFSVMPGQCCDGRHLSLSRSGL